MRSKLLAIVLVLCLTATAAGQDADYSIFSYRNFIPKVRINDRSVSLQQNVLPGLYRDRSVAQDMRWVAINDSALVDFWQRQGDTILHILTEFSGIRWHESEFDIYLVRYFPTIGSSDPLIIPIGGMSRGSLIEAAPIGSRLIFNLVFQVSKRMLAQASQPEDRVWLSIANHPLMTPGQYRLDNLALLLTYKTCQNVIGIDSTREAYHSAFVKNKFPGREIFEKYLKDTWYLSPNKPLSQWIAEEPANSPLVSVTRPPRRDVTVGQTAAQSVEGLPLKGQLGFSVRRGDGNNLIVDKVDPHRLAYACGLRAGDVIRRVGGRVVRNQRNLVENILTGLDKGSTVVEVSREGRISEVIFRPMKYEPFTEDYATEEYSDEVDTLNVDTTNSASDSL